MKNDTFNQIINANLASIDPGFGQFALAKLLRPDEEGPQQVRLSDSNESHGGLPRSQRTTAAVFV